MYKSSIWYSTENNPSNLLESPLLGGKHDIPLVNGLKIFNHPMSESNTRLSLIPRSCH